MTITREIVRMIDKRDQKPPVGNHTHSQYLTTAVTSLKKTASTPLVGNVELAEGANITLTQDDVLKKITIAAAGGGTTLKQWTRSYVGINGISTSAFLTKGFILEPVSNLVIWGIAMLWDEASTQSLKMAIYNLNGTTQVGAALMISPAFNSGLAQSGTIPSLLPYKAASSITLLAGSRYGVAGSNVTVGATIARIAATATNGDQLIGLMPATYCRINNNAPADGATWEVASAATPFHGAVLHEV